jgi:predicted RNase H-like HicB family nuclease
VHRGTVIDAKVVSMNFSIECERKEDGRWLAEIQEPPGVLAYDKTQDEAMARSEILVLRALAEQLENG